MTTPVETARTDSPPATWPHLVDATAARRFLPSREAWIAIAAGAAFITVSIWWLLYDNRIPGGGDPGRHLLEAIYLGGSLEGGDLLAPLTWESGSPFNYPPLVRTIGGIVAALGAPVYDWGPIALNLIFVPMLVAGCYLTGRLVFGPVAGVLAAAFALGAPMIMQLFHVYLLDAPLAAIVALSLWALLSTERFSRPGRSIAAGALIGLAMLVKTTAPVFLAGPLIVLLVRGGYRQIGNLARFAAAALVVAAPYYLIHLSEYVQLSKEAAISSEDEWTQGFGWTFDGARRFELENYTWYLWAGINTQYLVPLLGFLVVGLGVALSEVRRRPYLLELLAGLVIGYLAMTLLAVHDPRYTLPLVVYVAVLATGWITMLSRPWKALGAAGLIALVVLNTAAGTFGLLDTRKVTMSGDDPVDLIHPGAFTLVDKRGYVIGEPRSDPLWERLMEGMQEDGLDSAKLLVLETPTWGTDIAGFEVYADQNGIASPMFSAEAEQRPDVIATMWWTSDEFYITQRGFDPPCGAIEEGTWHPQAADWPRDEGMQVSVLVERRQADGGYERWCDFMAG